MGISHTEFHQNLTELHENQPNSSKVVNVSGGQRHNSIHMKNEI
jgi:hypothetical protein